MPVLHSTGGKDLNVGATITTQFFIFQVPRKSIQQWAIVITK